MKGVLVYLKEPAISAHTYRKAYGLYLSRPLRHSERVLGLALFKRMQQNARNGIILQSRHEITRANGQTMSAVLLDKRYISTSDPENIKAVIATNFADFDLGERNEAFRPLLGTGIFTQDGREWKRSRALLRPIFSRAQSSSELSLIEEHGQGRFCRIRRGGETVDLHLFHDLTLDSATHSLLGRPVWLAGSRPGGFDAERISGTFDEAQAYLQIWANLVMHAAIGGFISEAFDQRRRSSSSCRTRGKVGSGSRSESKNKSEGRDTTASLLSSVFYILARHPSIWRRLERKVLVEFDLAPQGEGKYQLPTYTQLREMKYVRAVLNKVLRQIPPVPTNIRIVTRHTFLPRGGGVDDCQPIFVTKGTIVHYSTRTMQRSTEICGDDAEQFRPERWLQPAKGSGKVPLRPIWGFLPFSGGPRICLGQQKALTEAAYVVVRMVQTFCDVAARDERPWREPMGCVEGPEGWWKLGCSGRLQYMQSA
ncbi:cytochrome P450 [Aspergillus spinulosporus]